MQDRTELLRRMTAIGLGTSQFGNLYRETTDDEVSAAFEAAWSGGVRYFDTAPHYGLGLSERRLGRVLAGRPRQEYVVSTKVGRLLEPSPDTANRMDDEGFAVPADFRRRFDFTRDGIRRSLESSLDRLGLDSVDIAYLHDPDVAADAEPGKHTMSTFVEAVDALVELRGEGLVRAVGTGTNTTALPTELLGQCDLDVVMIAGRYTLLDQAALHDLLPAAEARGVAVVAAGVYNSGLLSTDRVRSDARYDYELAGADLIARAERIADICEAHGVTLPAVALQFPLTHPVIASAVVGCRTAEQVASTLARLAAPVPDELWTALATEGVVEAAAVRR
jgi:D-threo-aldose 1-dehydrogenase